MRIVVPLVAAFALAACATTSAPSDDVDAATNAALDAANTAFSAAYMAGDAQTVIGAYTPDAVIHTPEGRLISTPASIAAMWAPISGAANGPRPTHQLRSTFRQRMEGGQILEVGSYAIGSRNQQGQEQWSRGCYTLVWRHAANGWLIHYDSWTSPRDPAPTCAPG